MYIHYTYAPLCRNLYRLFAPEESSSGKLKYLVNPSKLIRPRKNNVVYNIPQDNTRREVPIYNTRAYLTRVLY